MGDLLKSDTPPVVDYLKSEARKWVTFGEVKRTNR